MSQTPAPLFLPSPSPVWMFNSLLCQVMVSLSKTCVYLTACSSTWVFLVYFLVLSFFLFVELFNFLRCRRAGESVHVPHRWDLSELIISEALYVELIQVSAVIHLCTHADNSTRSIYYILSLLLFFSVFVTHLTMSAYQWIGGSPSSAWCSVAQLLCESHSTLQVGKSRECVS